MTDQRHHSFDSALYSPFLEYQDRLFGELGEELMAGNVYAVLDPGGSEEFLSRVLDLPPDRARCLYVKAAFQEHWAIAPYLVQLDASMVSWLVERVWQEPWGILARSIQQFDDLYRHFRRFMLVKDGEGKPLLFRFYDPRVLRAFLPTWDRRQLERFYGPISEFGYKRAPAASLTLVRLKELGAV